MSPRNQENIYNSGIYVDANVVIQSETAAIMAVEGYLFYITKKRKDNYFRETTS